METVNLFLTKKTTHNTRYVHWLADVHSGGFAPALAALICNSFCPSADGQRMLPPSADGQMPIASVVRRQCKKNKKTIKNVTLMNFRKKRHIEFDSNFQGLNLTEFSFEIEDDTNNNQIVDSFLRSEYYTYDCLRDCIKKEPNKGYLRSALNINNIEISDFRKYDKEKTIKFLVDYLNEPDWEEDKQDFIKLIDYFIEIINQSGNVDFYIISKDWFEHSDEKLIKFEYSVYIYYFLIILINKNSNSLTLTEWTYD